MAPDEHTGAAAALKLTGLMKGGAVEAGLLLWECSGRFGCRRQLLSAQLGEISTWWALLSVW